MLTRVLQYSSVLVASMIIMVICSLSFFIRYEVDACTSCRNVILATWAPKTRCFVIYATERMLLSKRARSRVGRSLGCVYFNYRLRVWKTKTLRALSNFLHFKHLQGGHPKETLS